MTDKNMICPYCGQSLTLRGEILGSEYHEEYAPKLRYSTIYRQKFDKGHIWKYSQIPMYCSRCDTHIELASNPFDLIEPTASLVILFNIVAVIIAKRLIPFLLLISALPLLLLCVFALFRRQWINKWRSNLVIKDKDLSSDNNISISFRGDSLTRSSKKALCETNLLWTEIPGSKIYFYTVSVKRSSDKYELRLMVSGISNEYSLLTKFLENQTAPALKLNFGDIEIGIAEVSEIYGLSQAG